MTIPADNDKVLGLMSSQGVKMVNLKIWFFVSLEEPEITYLAMSLVKAPK